MLSIVDKADAASVLNYSWHVVSGGGKAKELWYAVRLSCKDMALRKTIRLHRWLMGVTDPKVEVDHKNGNGLDNRRSNLRLSTHAQNVINSRTWANSKSGIKGVTRACNGKWRARIRDIQIGTFETKEEAAVAYLELSKRIHGEFSVHNRNQTNQNT